MKPNKLKVLMVAGLIAIGVMADAHYKSTLATEKFEWVMASPLTPALAYVPLYQKMIDDIRERSDGRLSITLLTAGQHPYKGGEIMTAVRDGIIQMGNTEDVYVSSMEPAIAFMGLPFLFDNLEHAKQTYEALKEPYFEKILRDRYNSEMLLGFLISGAAIHADAPLNSLDALKGRKIRVFGKESGQMIELLGGTPVTVAFAELYTALQRGTIDGAVTGMLGAQASKIYEVVKHNTWWNWSYAFEYIMVNEEAMASLPEDLQQIVREATAAAEVDVQALQDRLPAEVVVESLEKYSITVTGLNQETITQFRETTKPITEGWLETTGDEGKSAYTVYKAIAESRKK
ncbi:TRAP transporter substrate-binding protein DctP [Limibacillus sp. MBR-115]|jgi:C4-dicarboxylate-binding protein DctP|uniref:TRAP transporter substrate-binding protein n=1 Tax=Limibacillus sp. MBR-115 TaxID=3156465 RepID=UPI003395D149